ncbi:hypothetical protein GKIL_0741 [Gloeobacter kilaueensis JS1]|uniref:Uncharacterized protein n=1 Tax=Gloeobacter kilaueensis (strain ATCC BAA-2537 / CCAP 1431/1 / ULC 316 / JS1) TaxID=1183438 RepID=U5QDI0_GLOK1|nr:hypothetical protein GKIL_0741 [Gloeobacter kilaueensis JS1]
MRLNTQRQVNYLVIYFGLNWLRTLAYRNSSLVMPATKSSLCRR